MAALSKSTATDSALTSPRRVDFVRCMDALKSWRDDRKSSRERSKFKGASSCDGEQRESQRRVCVRR